MSKKDFQMEDKSSEGKENGHKYIMSKHEFDLYDEKSANVVSKVYRIKHTKSTTYGEKWRLFEDNRLFILIEASKIRKKDCDFLRSVSGVTFLLKELKSGTNTFSDLKERIKEEVDKLAK